MQVLLGTKATTTKQQNRRQPHHKRWHKAKTQRERWRCRKGKTASFQPRVGFTSSGLNFFACNVFADKREFHSPLSPIP